MNQTESSTHRDGVLQQAILELEIIGHVQKALNAVVQADFHEDGLGRKLATVQFVLGSFQRHVKRLFSMEEQDGYMTMLSESHPHLQHAIDQLRKQHEELNQSIRRLVDRSEAIKPTAVAEFNSLCRDVAHVTDQLVEHTRAEMVLLQDAYDQDTGGEG